MERSGRRNFFEECAECGPLIEQKNLRKKIPHILERSAGSRKSFEPEVV